MRIKWRGLELPTQVVRDDAISTDTYARLIIEPFERGFGTTVGNSLRRILLSSLIRHDEMNRHSARCRSLQSRRRSVGARKRCRAGRY